MANRHERRAAGAARAQEPARGQIVHGEAVPAEATISMFNAPEFYASGMQVAPFANEVIMTFTRARPGTASLGGVEGNVIHAAPVAIVTVNLMTFKEMLTAIQSVLDDYEKVNGEITTPFLEAQKAQKETAWAQASTKRKGALVLQRARSLSRRQARRAFGKQPLWRTRHIQPRPKLRVIRTLGSNTSFRPGGLARMGKVRLQVS